MRFYDPREKSIAFEMIDSCISDVVRRLNEQTDITARELEMFYFELSRKLNDKSKEYKE